MRYKMITNDNTIITITIHKLCTIVNISKTKENYSPYTYKLLTPYVLCTYTLIRILGVAVGGVFIN